MMGGRETLAPNGTDTANGDITTASSSPFTWGEGFMDIVAKYERNSERQLYVYGISVSRCASCRHRLKSDAQSCENCGHAVSTSFQTCTRCTTSKPGLWCYECDKYFCEPCHSQPHVLVLNGSAPEKHNCFPIDGPSGKLLRSGSWSSSLLAHAKTARRSQMKLREANAKKAEEKTDTNGGTEGVFAARSESLRAEEKTRSVDKERKMAAKETTRRSNNSRPPPVPTSSSRQPSQPPTPVHEQSPMVPFARATARSRSPSPVTAAPPLPPRPKTQKSPSPSPTKLAPAAIPPPPMYRPTPVRPNIVGDIQSAAPTLLASRKRKSPTASGPEGIDSSSIAQPAPQRPAADAREANDHDMTVQAGAGMSAETSDGMSLYARLRQMKNKQFQRSQSATASPAANVKAETTSGPTPPNPSPALPAPGPAPVFQVAPTTRETVVPTTDTPSHHSQSAQQSTAATPVGSASSTPTAQSSDVKADPMLEDVMSRPIEAPPASLVGIPISAQAASGAGTPFGVSVSLTDSALSSGSEDVLVDAVVGEYQRANTYVYMIEEKLQILIAAVRRATLQDFRRAAAINNRVEDYRNALRAANEHRERTLANVILFSPDIRAFAKSLSARTLQDVPHVMTSCHKNCAELAQKIRDAETKLQELRDAIDRAVSSADAEQFAQIPTLGQSMTVIEDQVRVYKKDRDHQFKLMFQFGRRVRDTVQGAITAMDTKRESRQPSN